MSGKLVGVGCREGSSRGEKEAERGEEYAGGEDNNCHGERGQGSSSTFLILTTSTQVREHAPVVLATPVVEADAHPPPPPHTTPATAVTATSATTATAAPATTTTQASTTTAATPTKTI